MDQRFMKKLYLGFLNVHILYHASKEPIYGVWMIEELNHHGYHVGPSHIYPMLRDLTKENLLSMTEKLEHGKIRKYYTITALGLEVLKELKQRARELSKEVFYENRES
ncbi:MAG: helix-turn-helix transcriptional regulator [Acholeplasma sp.]|nr:helix-turn-helix transcriptional regulator [Acholeplasma sp.]